MTKTASPKNTVAAPDAEANKDVGRLMEAALKSAQQRLGEGVVFAPFGFALNERGRAESLAAEDAVPSKAYTRLVGVVAEGLRAKKWRAAVLAFPCKVAEAGAKEKQDAIGLVVQHARLKSKRLVVPLEKDKRGKLKPRMRAKLPDLWNL